MRAAVAARRAWSGPAPLSAGFRPFFLLGALWAGAMIALWVPWHMGRIEIPSALDPLDWHAHELLFGYLSAVMAGFLLTAVPNWTGRLPVAGAPLAGLVGLWAAGRAAVALSAWIGAGPALAAALVFPLALCALLWREILAAGNRGNLPVAALVTVHAAAQAGFAAEALTQGYALYAPRAAIAAAVLLTALIGGRITPSFTANRLRRDGARSMPASFSGFDRAALAAVLAALAAWAAAPALPAAAARGAGAVMLAAGALLLARQLRWRPAATARIPILAVLHLAYAFVPAGLLLNGAAALRGDPALAAAGLHAWTAGAFGLMTLAVMTRAARGHTGRPLTAGPGTTALYLLAGLGALARIAAPLVPQAYAPLLQLSAAAWAAAFLGFAALHAGMLLGPRRGGG